MKRVAILGSTGSIGTQVLDIAGRNSGEFKVTVLSCAGKIRELEAQIEKFHPELAVTAEERDAIELSRKYPRTEFVFGEEGLVLAAKSPCDLVVNALMGIRGLLPTYHAILAGHNIAFANKETLVAGGELIMGLAAERGVKLLPVDSEHSAIFQCLQGNDEKKVRRLIITASGGPFRGYSRERLESVTLEQALCHPKWVMGSKITIDSATMMNKGLEIIEARWLFDVDEDKIDVVVHPQSIIHSMVEYEDRSIIAQLGLPDMRVPISYALGYPDRMNNDLASLDFFKEAGSLTFEKPDIETFKCMKLAREALKQGGSLAAALNGANEALVELFLKKKIKFIDIQNNIEKVMNLHKPSYHLTLGEILQVDQDARRQAKELALRG